MSQPTRQPSVSPGTLLERSRELAALDTWLEDAGERSRGRVVFMEGEAGVGKTALLRGLTQEIDSRTRVLAGACDPMFTPQPLGPLLDIAEATGGELGELVVTGAKPHAIGTALLRELAGTPTLLLIEDLHWADEATLDVLGLVARRINRVGTLAVATYRGDELDRRGPLRILLGELATAQDVMRMHLEPLSAQAVATLAAPHGIDAAALYRATGGNPFFVTEVLAGPYEQIPATVRDAVLARTSRLSPGARNLLDAAAVLLPPVALATLGALAPDAGSALEECLAAGMLVVTDGGVAFRHELSRLAVEESLSPGARVALHSQALAALSEGRPGTRDDAARLAHHAEEAADADAVLRFAPAAARAASTVGAHREATAQYSRALRFSDALPLDATARLLDGQTAERNLIGEFTAAIASGRAALECWQQLGARREEARALAALAWPLWVLGETAEAKAVTDQAIAALKDQDAGPELIRAYLLRATMEQGAESIDDAQAWGRLALQVAERLHDPAGAVEARVPIAAGDYVRRRPGGREELEQLLAVARRDGLEWSAAYAFCYLARGAAAELDHARAASYADQGIDYCTTHDLEGFRPYLIAVRSASELAQGMWAEAADSAEAVVALHGAGLGTALALGTLGRVRARRGDPAVWEALDEALRVAEPSGEIGRLGPVAAARAEAAWLEGRFDAVIEATDSAIRLAARSGAWPILGELSLWRRRAGLAEAIPPAATPPYAAQLSGDWCTAAAQWKELGVPYEAALALADGDDEDALRQALDELHRMNAAPAAAIVSRRLRSGGARGLPRGPRPQTRENPANLTARELEILALVADGLRNAEIAKRLFLSQKTVAHHVSAILRKLDVHTRGEAAAAAVRLGLTAQDR